MIGNRSGGGRRRLGHVEPVHLRGGLANPAAVCEVARVAHVAGDAGAEQIRVEDDDHVGLIEPVDVGGLAEGERRAAVNVLPRDGLALVPARPGAPRGSLSPASRASASPRCCSRIAGRRRSALQLGKLVLHRLREARPRTRLAKIRDRLAAVGVAQREDGAPPSASAAPLLDG